MCYSFCNFITCWIVGTQILDHSSMLLCNTHQVMKVLYTWKTFLGWFISIYSFYQRSVRGASEIWALWPLCLERKPCPEGAHSLLVKWWAERIHGFFKIENVQNSRSTWGGAIRKCSWGLYAILDKGEWSGGGEGGWDFKGKIGSLQVDGRVGTCKILSEPFKNSSTQREVQ